MEGSVLSFQLGDSGSLLLEAGTIQLTRFCKGNVRGLQLDDLKEGRCVSYFLEHFKRSFENSTNLCLSIKFLLNWR